MGNVEDRTGTISVFNGPNPSVIKLDTQNQEIETVAAWLSNLANEGLKPHEIGVFVRSDAELDRATDSVSMASMKFKVLDEHV